MDISIVIVNYNVKEFIIPCIQSIYNHSKSRYSFEIIVVDNNSKDGSKHELIQKFPKVLLIENNYNAGFSRAINQGVKKARGKYLFILNPDTLLVEDSLRKLIEKANDKKNLGAIGPVLISEKGSIQQSYWRYPSLINTILSIFHLDFLNYYKNYSGKKFDGFSKVDSISGGAFFLPKNIFIKLGGFNEDLFWMEDIDFCLRLNKIGFITYYFTKTKIIHFKGKSAEKNYKIAISNQLKSKIKFFNKHHYKLSAFIILISVISISIIKLALLLFAIPFSKSYRKKFFAYFYTIRSIFKLI